MKFDLRITMPTRTPPEPGECELCGARHGKDGHCEGFGFDHTQEPAYETAQVENSSYLQKALAQFRRKRAKKNAKD